MSKRHHKKGDTKHHRRSGNNGGAGDSKGRISSLETIERFEGEMNHVANIELPPDEIDEQLISKSFFHSALSLIPYSNAWYESRAAEYELDNFSRIQAEKQKASDYVELTRIGEYEIALSAMLKETNNDFFYFNKLRTKLQKRGTHFPSSSSSSSFKRRMLLSNQGVGYDESNNSNKPMLKNRLRQARAMNFALMNNQQLAGTHNVVGIDTDIHTLSRTAPCTWRGKNKEGYILTCQNKRMLHPTKCRRSPDGEMIPDMMIYCPYHITHCLSKFHTNTSNNSVEEVRIVVPNNQGLCTECYLNLGIGKPPNLNVNNVPGVKILPSNTITVSSGSSKYSLINKNKFPSLSSKSKTTATAIITTSTAKKDSTNDEFTTNFNAQSLIRTSKPHHPHYSDNINNNNRSNYGDKSFNNDSYNHNNITNTHTNTTHWAMPSYSQPPDDIELTPYVHNNGTVSNITSRSVSLSMDNRRMSRSSNAESSVTTTMNNTSPVKKIKNIILSRYYWRSHTEAAVVIQAWYRGHKTRERVYKTILLTKYAIERHHAAICIQAYVRCFLYAKDYTLYKQHLRLAAIVIQSNVRGYFTRKWYITYRAATIIQKFMRHIYYLKFQDTDIMIQLQLFFKNRDDSAIMIQKLFRGYRIRQWLFQQRLDWFIKTRNCNIIKKFLTAVIRQRRVKEIKIELERETEQLVHMMISTRIVYWIENKYCAWKTRIENQKRIFNAVLLLQRIARGYLCRLGVRRLKALKSKLYYLLFGSHEFDNGNNNTASSPSISAPIANNNNNKSSNFLTHKSKQSITQTQCRQERNIIDIENDNNSIDSNNNSKYPLLSYELSAFPSMSSISILSEDEPSSTAAMINYNNYNNDNNNLNGDNRKSKRNNSSSSNSSSNNNVNTDNNKMNRVDEKGRGFLLNNNKSYNSHNHNKSTSISKKNVVVRSNDNNNTSTTIKSSSVENNYENDNGDNTNYISAVVPFRSSSSSSSSSQSSSSSSLSSSSFPSIVRKYLPQPQQQRQQPLQSSSSLSHFSQENDYNHSISNEYSITTTATTPPATITYFTHEVKLDIFKQALYNYFSDLQLTINSQEYDAIVTRFLNQTTGNLNITSLDDYISLHNRPCRKHGYTICAKCCYYGQCMVADCHCTVYTNKSQPSNTTTGCGLCECSHMRNKHRLSPEHLKPIYQPNNKINNNNNHLLLDSIIHAPRELDYCKPTTITGINAHVVIKKIQRKEKLKHKKYTEKERLIQIQNKIHKTSMKAQQSQQLRDIHALQKFSFNEPNNNNNNNMSNKNTVSTSVTTTSTTATATSILPPTSPHHQIHVKHSPIVPTAVRRNYNAAADPEFWRSAGLLPIQSKADYMSDNNNSSVSVTSSSCHYQSNIPMPYLLNQEIVYTYEGIKAYNQILDILKKMWYNTNNNDGDLISENSYAFLELIMNHIQLFERHWRKMIVDIRNGTYASAGNNNNNNNGNASENKNDNDCNNLAVLLITRNDGLNNINNNNLKFLPNIPLATKLDSVFRQLGFHKKAVGGQDLDLHPFAELKIVK